MEPIPFIKMHGLGNDFVVLDARASNDARTVGSVAIGVTEAAAIADRRRGVGCDQLIVLEQPKSDLADLFMRIRNPDGGEAGACGNATRCVASLVMNETGKEHVIIETVAGLLDAERDAADGLVTVDMGPAYLDWREIPLSEPVDTLHLNIGSGPLQDPVGVGMGNPHAVFFVDDAEAVDLTIHGPVIETHKLFPEFTNVEVAHINPDGTIRMRVWERAAGITQACGSGACAALVAAARRGLIEGRKADVILDGGTLTVEWLADNHVTMTGPVATSFTGQIDPALFNGGGQ